MKGKCCWVIKTWKANAGAPMTPPVYCHKPTKYKMVADEDGNKIRTYNHFCEEHEQKAQQRLIEE